MKIAVPVEMDNLTIETRTGQAEFFAIFEDNKFIELRENPKHSHSHTHQNHNEEHTNEHKNQVAVALNDVDVIIVRMVGEHMAEALEDANIEIVTVHQDDGEKADEVVKKYLEGEFK
jgi:predicted Fe-Mo cluster-binding NifX family protein